MFLRTDPPTKCAMRPARFLSIFLAGRTLFRRVPTSELRPGAYPLRSGLHLFLLSVRLSMPTDLRRALVIAGNNSVRDFPCNS